LMRLIGVANDFGPAGQHVAKQRVALRRSGHVPQGHWKTITFVVALRVACEWRRQSTALAARPDHSGYGAAPCFARRATAQF
jgi:hypothetical protein